MKFQNVIIILSLFINTANTKAQLIDHISCEIGYRSLINKEKKMEKTKIVSSPAEVVFKPNLTETGVSQGSQTYQSSIIAENEIFSQFKFNRTKWIFQIDLGMLNSTYKCFGYGVQEFNRNGAGFIPDSSESIKRYLRYSVNVVAVNIQFGIGYNVIPLARKLRIIPFARIGMEKMLKMSVLENTITVEDWRSPVPTVYNSLSFDNNAENYVTVNKKYNKPFFTSGVQIGYLFNKNWGVNSEIGYHSKGNVRMAYGQSQLYRNGVYASLGVVYQIALKGK